MVRFYVREKMLIVDFLWLESVDAHRGAEHREVERVRANVRSHVRVVSLHVQRF